MEPISDDFRLKTPPYDCSYLAGKKAIMDYRVIQSLSDEQYDILLSHGWRRHGIHIFRPNCVTCHECKSLRIPIGRFQASKSQRRILRKNQNLRMIVQQPSMSRQHIDLFNRYHADMQIRRGWPFQPITQEDYFQSFLSGGYTFEREFLYFRDESLMAVGLVDVTAMSGSSVYFFHDPDGRSEAFGTYSILKEIEYLESTGASHYYLGYWISACPSMNYKNRFGPHEIHDAYGDDDVVPVWKPTI